MRDSDVHLGSIYINKFKSIKDIIDEHNLIENYLKEQAYMKKEQDKKYQTHDFEEEELKEKMNQEDIMLNKIPKNKKSKVSFCGAVQNMEQTPKKNNSLAERGRHISRDTVKPKRTRSNTPPFTLTPSRVVNNIDSSSKKNELTMDNLKILSSQDIDNISQNTNLTQNRNLNNDLQDIDNISQNTNLTQNTNLSQNIDNNQQNSDNESEISNIIDLNTDSNNTK